MDNILNWLLLSPPTVDTHEITIIKYIEPAITGIIQSNINEDHNIIKVIYDQLTDK